LIATDEPANEGTFRPLKLILPEGKLLSAMPTAPMGLYSIPFPTVIDCIIKALEHALPQRMTGAHFGTSSSLRFFGNRSENGTPFNSNDAAMVVGALAARPTTAPDHSGPWRMATCD
jgi:N-methylhydantoinase B